MKRSKVIAKVLNPGQCRYYRAGQEFFLGGFTPKGLCDSAYAALSRDAQTLAYGGTLPWQKGGAVQTHCPDPVGVVWELRVESSAPQEAHPWQIESCLALEGGCPNALTELKDLAKQLDAVVRDSGWTERAKAGPTGRTHRPHNRLRVALAACPNACTQPQIRDIGLIASVRPDRVSPSCTGCGQCAMVCREGAIVMEDGLPKLDGARCLGCGACGTACPHKAMEMGERRFRILVGGRMGRHPAWALELPATVERAQVAPIVAQLLKTAEDEAGEGETFGATARRLGAALWQNVPELHVVAPAPQPVR